MTPSAISRSARCRRRCSPGRRARFGLDRISWKAAVTRSLVAPPPTSRKFAGCAAVQLDQVHGRHREARAIDHAGDVAVQGDVVEVVLARAPLHRVFLAGVAQRGELRLAEERVGVDVDLGVQRHERAGLGDDQRIDLDQARVRSMYSR